MKTEILMKAAMKTVDAVLPATIEPGLYIHTTDGGVGELPYKHDDKRLEDMLKDLAIMVVGSMVKANQFAGASMVAEAWMAGATSKELAGILPPRLDPDRKEIVVMIVWGDDCTREAKMFELKDRKLGAEIPCDAKLETWLDAAFEAK